MHFRFLNLVTSLFLRKKKIGVGGGGNGGLGGKE